MTVASQNTLNKSKDDIPLGPLLGPKTHLALFSWCQILVYFDRGSVSGMLNNITKEVDGAHSKFLAGFLGGMFMIGYMIASPLFVRLSQKSRSWTIYAIIIGLGILAVSAITTYFVSHSFVALLLVRLISGAGEAAFCSLAPPIIDDSAPVGKKSLYVGLYFTFLYVGFGLGSGVCSIFSTWESGRLLFLVEAGMIVPCIAAFAYLRHRFAVPQSIREDVSKSSDGGSLKDQIRVIMKQTTFVLFSVGYGAFFFSFGAFAFWTITVMKHIYPEDQSVADMGFGAVTIITGIVGTAAGGLLMDLVCKRLATRESLRNHPSDSIRVIAGSVICSVLVLAGMIFTFPAVFAPSVYVFLLFFAVGTLLLFSTTAPVNIAIMYSVPAGLKAQSMAISTGMSHLLGDFPSPFVVGALIDGTGYKTAMVATSVILVLPAILWGAAGWVAKTKGANVLDKPPADVQRQMTQAGENLAVATSTSPISNSA